LTCVRGVVILFVSFGFSARCVKDRDSLGNGIRGTFSGTKVAFYAADMSAPLRFSKLELYFVFLCFSHKIKKKNI
jgi:hypothetical protein